MEHPARRQPSRAGCHGSARLRALRVSRSELGHDLATPRAVDRAVHTGASSQRGICRVGYGIDPLCRDVAVDQLQAPSADLDHDAHCRQA